MCIRDRIEMLPADGLVGLWKVAGVDVQVTATTKLEEEDGPVSYTHLTLPTRDLV